jgi:hypothetical protein
MLSRFAFPLEKWQPYFEQTSTDLIRFSKPLKHSSLYTYESDFDCVGLGGDW